MTANKGDVRQGTLALMVLKTLETMGLMHGYGIARRIEQTSGNLLSVNYGTFVSGADQTLNSKAGLPPNGDCRRTIEKRSITGLRVRGTNNSRRSRLTGSRRPRSSRDF